MGNLTISMAIFHSYVSHWRDIRLLESLASGFALLHSLDPLRPIDPGKASKGLMLNDLLEEQQCGTMPVCVCVNVYIYIYIYIYTYIYI